MSSNIRYKSANEVSYQWISTLENGHTVNSRLKVGDDWHTQWGPRKVVSVELVREVFNRFDGWDNGGQ